MKYRTIILALTAPIIFVFWGCSKEEMLRNTAHTNLTSPTLKLNVNIGSLHNSFMDNLLNFEEAPTYSSLQEVVDDVAVFHQSFVSMSDLDSSSKQQMIVDIDTYKNFMIIQTFIPKAFGWEINDSLSDTTVFDMLQFLRNDTLISEFAFNTFTSLMNSVEQNLNGILSDSLLKCEVNELISQHNNHNYDSELGDGKFVDVVLSISISSIEWWEDHPEEVYSHAKVAPWIAADIVGGMFAGGIALYNQDEPINWTAVGISAGAGALMGSTGAALKVGRIISSWF